jgi:hypothetical protein
MLGEDTKIPKGTRRGVVNTVVTVSHQAGDGSAGRVFNDAVDCNEYTGTKVLIYNILIRTEKLKYPEKTPVPVPHLHDKIMHGCREIELGQQWTEAAAYPPEQGTSSL